MSVLAKYPSSSGEVLPTFEQLARIFAAKLSSSVLVPVLITDELGRVIVDGACEGKHEEGTGKLGLGGQRQVRIPFHMADCAGTVVFYCHGSSWDESPGILATVTRQLVAQTLNFITPQPRRQPRDLFVYRLLNSGYANNREALELAQLWHIDLSMPRSVVLIETGGSASANSSKTLPMRATLRRQQQMQEMRDKISELFRDLDGTICAYIGGGRVALLMAQNHIKASNDRIGSADFVRTARTILEKAAQTHTAVAQGVARDHELHFMHVAAGNPYNGLYGLTRSYREALQSLEKRSDPCVWQLPWTIDAASTPCVAGEGLPKFSGLA